MQTLMSSLSCCILSRSRHRRCSVKKVFLEIVQNSQENTCVGVSFLIKLQASGLRPATLLKKRVWRKCFPVNFAKFLGIPFLQSSSGRLLLSFLHTVRYFFSSSYYVSDTRLLHHTFEMNMRILN